MLKLTVQLAQCLGLISIVVLVSFHPIVLSNSDCSKSPIVLQRNNLPPTYSLPLPCDYFYTLLLLRHLTLQGVTETGKRFPFSCYKQWLSSEVLIMQDYAILLTWSRWKRGIGLEDNSWYYNYLFNGNYTEKTDEVQSHQWSQNVNTKAIRREHMIHSN